MHLVYISAPLPIVSSSFGEFGGNQGWGGVNAGSLTQIVC